MQAGACILVAMIDPAHAPRQFQRTRLGWPLHVTLVPWFTVQNVTDLQHRLHSIIAQETSFIAETGEDTFFGAQHDTPVSLIANRQPFVLLHNVLLELLDDIGAHFVASQLWLRREYRPHVTHHGSDRLHPGYMFPVETVTLVQLQDEQNCEIVDTLLLRKQSA